MIGPHESQREYELAMRQAEETEQYYDYVNTDAENNLQAIEKAYNDNSRESRTMRIRNKDVFYRMAEITGYAVKRDTDGVAYFVFKMHLITFRA